MRLQRGGGEAALGAAEQQRSALGVVGGADEAERCRSCHSTALGPERAMAGRLAGRAAGSERAGTGTSVAGGRRAGGERERAGAARGSSGGAADRHSGANGATAGANRKEGWRVGEGQQQRECVGEGDGERGRVRERPRTTSQAGSPSPPQPSSRSSKTSPPGDAAAGDRRCGGWPRPEASHRPPSMAAPSPGRRALPSHHITIRQLRPPPPMCSCARPPPTRSNKYLCKYNYVDAHPVCQLQYQCPGARPRRRRGRPAT